MHGVNQEKQFRRDYERQKRRGKNIAKLEVVVAILAEEGRVGASRRPHKLSGEWEGYWECHIEQDWLLIYKVTEKEVLLARTGTHADLFE